MSIQQSIGRVTEIMPKFNKYLLCDYRKNNIDRFPEFMSTVFKEAVKLCKGDLKYLGYRRLTPEERLEYSANQQLSRNKISILQNEMSLINFMFDYLGQHINVPLYVPYLHENALIINDTHFHVLFAIIERMIYHVPEGVIIKVMRSPLNFWRNKQLAYESTDGEHFYDIVVTMRAHFRKNASKKAMQTPLVLYLLAHYGFSQALDILGIPPGAISFTTAVPTDRDPKTDGFVYFKCTNTLFLKVAREIIDTENLYNLNRRVVASLIYIMKMTKQADITNVTNITFYKSILGRNLYPTVNNNLLAADHANSHLESLSTYLDEYTKRELEELQIYCTDIFDLFVNVFTMIDEWSTWYSVNDLFTKRIGGTDLLLIRVVQQVFNRFYDAQRKHKVNKPQSINTMLRLPVMCIPQQCIKVQSVRSNNNMYNDNDLFPNLIKKIRNSSSQNGSKNGNIITDKEHRFHASFAAVESLLALSQSSPGISGDINPYVQIDENGNFLVDKMPWYKDIEGLQKYLFNV